MRVCKYGCIRFARIFEDYFVKAIEHFVRVYILGGLGEFSKLMQTLDYVSGLYNCLEFSQPSSSLDEAI